MNPRFSDRTAWSREPNPLSLTLEGIRNAGREIIDLTVANPTLVGLEYPEKEVINVLAEHSGVSYSPHARGLATARRAIAGYYAAKGMAVDYGQMILTAGTSEAYGYLFRLLCNPGDSVAIPTPSYPLFDYLAALHDVVLRPYRISYDGEWHIDMSSLEEVVSRGVRAIILVHPNNPTGSFLKKREMEEVCRIASGGKAALIVDEVFSDYSFRPDESRLVTTAGMKEVLTFALSGLSKLAGLPQMKLGWIVVSGPSSLRQEALSRLEIISDTFLSCSTVVQQALPDLMKIGSRMREKISMRTHNNLDVLKSLIVKHSRCSLLAPEGGWYVILKVPGVRSDEEWAISLLEKQGVYVHPGYFFDMQQKGHLVVSLLAPPDQFREGVNQVLRAVENEL